MKIFMDTNGDARCIHETAHFGWQNERSAYIGICKGFKEAADQLIKDVLDREHNEIIRDQYILPILYCYRHSIETSLKLGFYLLKHETKNGHDLIAIWNAVEQEVLSIMPDGKKILDDISEVRDMLNELQGTDCDTNEETPYEDVKRTDKRGDVWKYLIANDGKMYFNLNHGISYPNLKKVMDELYGKLDYLNDMIYRHYVTT